MIGAALLAVSLGVHAASQVVVGAAAQSKMDQCNLSAQYAVVAAQIRSTSNNYHAYVVGVDEIIQRNQESIPNAWSVANETGKYVFRDGRIRPADAYADIYKLCMMHPEHFGVKY
jgi:hypothetical protein